ncbi:MAG: hypothetical protein AAFR51_00165 [Pseudomonadota bacterium]
MLIKHLTALTLASAAGLFFSLEAEANSRFTVENQMDVKTTIYIFSGGDGACNTEEKIKTVSAGKTDSFGCTGNGKNRCKIQIYVNRSSSSGIKQICKKQMNACHGQTRRMQNGDKVTLSKDEDDEFVCSFD